MSLYSVRVKCTPVLPQELASWRNPLRYPRCKRPATLRRSAVTCEEQSEVEPKARRPQTVNYLRNCIDIKKRLVYKVPTRHKEGSRLTTKSSIPSRGCGLFCFYTQISAFET